MNQNNVSDKKEALFYQKESENLQIIAVILENGLQINFSPVGKPLLGTVAVSLPVDSIGLSRERKTSKTDFRRGLTTSNVIGSRNEIFAKALAEKAVIKTGKIVYLSVNFEENNEELYIEAKNLLEEFLQTLQL